MAAISLFLITLPVFTHSEDGDMAFDRNDPADLLALKTEVNTDPIGMGYAAVVEQTQQLLKLLNDPANNVGGDTASRIFEVDSMMDALDPTDFEAPQTGANAAEYVIQLIAYGGQIGSIVGFETKFRSMFAVNSGTIVALDAQNVTLSRAEVLFGQGTVITRDDWIAARDS